MLRVKNQRELREEAIRSTCAIGLSIERECWYIVRFFSSCKPSVTHIGNTFSKALYRYDLLGSLLPGLEG